MTPKIKKAGTVPRRWVDPLSRAQRQSYITACNLASSHEELARRDRLGSAVRTGLDFEPRPSYLIPTAETTRECPDPFPAPTETESQCRKEAPLATNSLKIAQNHELSASAHTFAPFLYTLFVNFVRIFLLLTLITQDLRQIPPIRLLSSGRARLPSKTGNQLTVA